MAARNADTCMLTFVSTFFFSSYGLALLGPYGMM